MNFTRVVFAFALLVALALVPQANAVTVALGPGSTVAAILDTDPVTGTLEDQITHNLTPIGNVYGGTMTEALYRELSGTLTWYIQVASSSNSIDDIERQTNASFAGYASSVAFRSDFFGPFVAGNVAPTTVTRDGGPGNDRTIGFNFAGGLPPNMTSMILEIRTNATQYNREGLGSTINSATYTGFMFQPTGEAVPEPGTWAMLGSGLLALVVGKYRRRKSTL